MKTAVKVGKVGQQATAKAGQHMSEKAIASTIKKAGQKVVKTIMDPKNIKTALIKGTQAGAGKAVQWVGNKIKEHRRKRKVRVIAVNW